MMITGEMQEAAERIMDIAACVKEDDATRLQGLESLGDVAPFIYVPTGVPGAA